MSVCLHTDSIRKVVFDDLPSGELASKAFTSVSEKFSIQSTLARHTSSDKDKDKDKNKDNDKGLRALALIRPIRAHLSTPPLLCSVPQGVVPVQHRAQFVTKLFCRKKRRPGEETRRVLPSLYNVMSNESKTKCLSFPPENWRRAAERVGAGKS